MFFTSATAGLLLMALPAGASGTELGLRDARFTLNGRPVFLIGISYYGALGAPRQFIDRDLADMEQAGINWIRVWATWSAHDNDVSAVDAGGRQREPYFDNLEWLVKRCDRHGMVVDITLSRGDGATGPPRLQLLDSHRRAAKTLVTELKVYRNWYLDLANEHNVRDGRFVSMDELQQLRDAVKGVDPQRLVTASHAGDIPRDALREYLLKVRVDFVAPHRPREQKTPAETEAKSREVLGWMKQFDRVVPLLYQEPFRRDYGEWQPQAEDFLADLRGACRGGAAGWCLHNGSPRRPRDGQPRRSFDLREKRLFEQLDDQEQKAVTGLRQISAADCRIVPNLQK